MGTSPRSPRGVGRTPQGEGPGSRWIRRDPRPCSVRVGVGDVGSAGGAGGRGSAGVVVLPVGRRLLSQRLVGRRLLDPRLLGRLLRRLPGRLLGRRGTE